MFTHIYCMFCALYVWHASSWSKAANQIWVVIEAMTTHVFSGVLPQHASMLSQASAIAVATSCARPWSKLGATSGSRVTGQQLLSAAGWMLKKIQVWRKFGTAVAYSDHEKNPSNSSAIWHSRMRVCTTWRCLEWAFWKSLLFLLFPFYFRCFGMLVVNLGLPDFPNLAVTSDTNQYATYCQYLEPSLRMSGRMPLPPPPKYPPPPKNVRDVRGVLILLAISLPEIACNTAMKW